MSDANPSAELVLHEELGRGIDLQLEALAKYERELSTLEFERCYLIQPDGNVYTKDGGSDAIWFNPTETVRFKDSILTHSHPRGFPISDLDIRLAMVTDLAVIRAVRSGQSQTVALIRPPDGWPRKTLVKEALIRADEALMKLLLRREYANKPTLSEFEVEDLRWRIVQRFLPQEMAIEIV